MLFVVIVLVLLLRIAIQKTATFPDHFGDYEAIFVLKTTEDNYHKILNHLKKRGFASKPDNDYSPDTENHVIQNETKD